MKVYFLLTSLLINFAFSFYSHPCLSSLSLEEQQQSSELRKRNKGVGKHTYEIVTKHENNSSAVLIMAEEEPQHVRTHHNNFSIEDMINIDLNDEDLEETIKYYEKSRGFKELQKEIYGNALKNKGNSSYVLGFIYEKKIETCHAELDRNYTKKNAVHWYTLSFKGNNSSRDLRIQEAIQRVISSH